MLNVSTRSICLLRKGNRTFPSHFFSFFFPVDSQLCEIIALRIPSFLMCRSFAVGWEEGGKKTKKVEIRSLQSATTFVCSVILWESPNATVLSLHLSRDIELWPSLEVLPCLFTRFWQNKPLFILAVTTYLSSGGDMKAAALLCTVWLIVMCNITHKFWS